MKCISLIQPWATLILSGAKRFETRGWRTPYRGPLATHASGRFPSLPKSLCHKEPFQAALRAAGVRCWTEPPLGKLLGVVTLEDRLRSFSPPLPLPRRPFRAVHSTVAPHPRNIQVRHDKAPIHPYPPAAGRMALAGK